MFYIEEILAAPISKEEIIATGGFDVGELGDSRDPLFGAETFASKKCIKCKPNPCYGHCGYLTLPYLVCNPVFATKIRKKISMICRSCGEGNNDGKSCRSCGAEMGKVSLDVMSDDTKIGEVISIGLKEAKEMLISQGDDFHMFITDVIAILPKMMRISSPDEVKETQIETSHLKLIRAVHNRADRKTIANLYSCVISGNDQEKKKSSIMANIKGKEGVGRHIMITKRVDDCGRAVIVGDDHIAVDEIVIPKKVAKKLFRYMVVTKENYEQTIKLWRDGEITSHDGDTTDVSRIRTGGVVRRRIQNGDLIIANRQPSLSKVSMMCHKAIVSQDDSKCIRLNTAVTPPYAADFDGDEMNVFFHSSIDEIEDELTNMSVLNNVFSLKGKINVYPIQDTITTIYKITTYPTKLDKCLYFDCCMECDNYSIPYRDEMTSVALADICLPQSLYYDNKGTTIEGGRVIRGSIDRNAVMGIIRACREAGENPLDLINKLQRVTHRYNCYKNTTTVGYEEMELVDGNMIDTMEEEDISALSAEIISQGVKNDGMYNMIMSGGKGNKNNYCHLSISVGKQFVNNVQVGFCRSSFFRGLTPEEYLLHQRGGREGVIKSNVNTAEIGYNSRKTCKAMARVKKSEDGYITDMNRILRLPGIDFPAEGL
jgi:DNA-directed RNA polymerase beta' subunit